MAELTLEDQFRFEEYKMLRNEIALRIEDGFKIMVYTALGCAAVYSVILTSIGIKTQPPSNPDLINYYMYDTMICAPLAIALLGWLKASEINYSIYSAAQYVLQIEDYFKIKAYTEGGVLISCMGWEHYLMEHRKERWIANWTIGRSNWVFWISMFVFTSGVAVGFWKSAP